MSSFVLFLFYSYIYDERVSYVFFRIKDKHSAPKWVRSAELSLTSISNPSRIHRMYAGKNMHDLVSWLQYKTSFHFSLYSLCRFVFRQTLQGGFEGNPLFLLREIQLPLPPSPVEETIRWQQGHQGLRKRPISFEVQHAEDFWIHDTFV